MHLDGRFGVDKFYIITSMQIQIHALKKIVCSFKLFVIQIVRLFVQIVCSFKLFVHLNCLLFKLFVIQIVCLFVHSSPVALLCLRLTNISRLAKFCTIQILLFQNGTNCTLLNIYCNTTGLRQLTKYHSLTQVNIYVSVTNICTFLLCEVKS